MSATDDTHATRRGSECNDMLGPLPEARKPDEHGIGWFTAGQMHAYALQERAAERERWKARVEEAFRDGFCAPQTYNDTVQNTADEEWEKSKADLLRA